MPQLSLFDRQGRFLEASLGKNNMLININCAKCVGIDAVPVTVEVDIRGGVGIHLVGLADTAVKESLLRTVTALQALDFHVPGKKIIINLAPADLHKSGSGYDLPIALGIIAASGQRLQSGIGDYLIMGELGLDGSVRDIPGALPYAQNAQQRGLCGCILPLRSALEASELKECNIYGVETLLQAVEILEDPLQAERYLIWNTDLYSQMQRRSGSVPAYAAEYTDFSDIIGQEGAKRGMEIAAAGGHNIIMIGPPGAGKSSLAKALPGILPPMSREEAMLSSKLYSVAGKGSLLQGLMRRRPFRAPHYSASLPAIIGGGGAENIIPGEVSLAQGGVLFLDEFAQMPKGVMEALRGPMEDRKVTISRLRSKVEFPASFMLVAASNPCPCGYYGDGEKCICTPTQRANYLARLSGPLMDRIDIQIWLDRIPPEVITRRQGKPEASAQVAVRVLRARELQRSRFLGESILTNAEMNNKHIEKYCPLSAECYATMTRLMENMSLSMRAYYRIIKVARTIADLGGAQDLKPAHLAEAASYRFLDKQKLF
jgi:magnesium chelatase family protein